MVLTIPKPREKTVQKGAPLRPRCTAPPAKPRRPRARQRKAPARHGAAAARGPALQPLGGGKKGLENPLENGGSRWTYSIYIYNYIYLSLSSLSLHRPLHVFISIYKYLYMYIYIHLHVSITDFYHIRRTMKSLGSNQQNEGFMKVKFCSNRPNDFK